MHGPYSLMCSQHRIKHMARQQSMTVCVHYVVAALCFISFCGHIDPNAQKSYKILQKLSPKQLPWHLAHRHSQPCFSDVWIGHVFYRWPEMAKCFLSYLSSTFCKIIHMIACELLTSIHFLLVFLDGRKINLIEMMTFLVSLWDLQFCWYNGHMTLLREKWP